MNDGRSETDVPRPDDMVLADEVPIVPADRFRWRRWLRWAGVIAAALAVAVLWLDERFVWFEYQPGGTAFFTYVRPVGYVLLLLGSLVAVKWEIAGGVIAAFAAGAIGAFAVNQLTGRGAVVVIVLLAVPAVIWVFADLLGWTRRQAAIGFTGALLATGAGVAVGEGVYEQQFGPTHPESATAPLPASPLRWIWSGGVTSEEAAVTLRTERDDVDAVRLVVTAVDSPEQPILVEPAERDGPITTFAIDDLVPDTRYTYAAEVDGVVDDVRTGTFTTFPNQPTSFSFTVGACARVGSNGSVFDAIRAEEPLFHLIAGDFHYGDIPEDNRERYDEVIDLTLRQPAQAALYRDVPIAYVWDDHDYGVNDSSSLSASRRAAMEAYRVNVPSYPLASDLSSVYQSFDVGRVRFLLTDARSSREPGESMFGAEQLEWFLDELVSASQEQALVVWLNPVPWVAEEEAGADNWAGYADERRRIANVIADNDVDNLLMVSGDAHMVAIDDGTNTDYSDAGDGGFPLIHAAALDRPGSIKGGPYSHGAIGGDGQYALVEVDDSGSTINVSLRAKRFDGEVLLSYDFEVPDAAR